MESAGRQSPRPIFQITSEFFVSSQGEEELAYQCPAAAPSACPSAQRAVKIPPRPNLFHQSPLVYVYWKISFSLPCQHLTHVQIQHVNSPRLPLRAIRAFRLGGSTDTKTDALPTTKQP